LTTLQRQQSTAAQAINFHFNMSPAMPRRRLPAKPGVKARAAQGENTAAQVGWSVDEHLSNAMPSGGRSSAPYSIGVYLLT